MADEFDVIIIGGGTAGSVLSSRLSEIPNKRILLLEAGGDHSANPKLWVPGGGQALWPDQDVNWNYDTVPQAAYGNRSINHPRGKGLGGSTLLNLNCMTFPDKQSLDSFGEIGNPGWSFDALARYLRKFHTFHQPDQSAKEDLGLDYMDPSLHGTSGPVQVSYGNHHGSIFNSVWPRTFEKLGRKSKVDPLSGRALGAVSAPSTTTPGSWTRSFAAAAYLTAEVQGRDNLEIVTRALVEKIIVEDGVAKGARYKAADGQSHTVFGKEVILCGGTFNSPQILELSGIGPRKILDKFGIPVVVDLPGVGESLQDHTVIGVSFEANVETMDSFQDPAKLGAAVKQYQENRSGPFAAGTYSMAFLPCAKDSFGPDDDLAALLRRTVEDHSLEPDLRKQYELISRIVGDPDLSSVQYVTAPAGLHNLVPGATSEKPQKEGAQYISVLASLSHPFSRGSCHIASADPGDPPVIDPRYFEHPADVEIVARHLQFLKTITQTEPLADLLVSDGQTIPANVNLDDLEYVKNKLIGTGFTTYHPCGTCAMKPRKMSGVVDERLRVYGVSGLRVVDASIFPLIPRGNIVSSVYAVAEKAADLIKEDWE